MLTRQEFHEQRAYHTDLRVVSASLDGSFGYFYCRDSRGYTYFICHNRVENGYDPFLAQVLKPDGRLYHHAWARCEEEAEDWLYANYEASERALRGTTYTGWYFTQRRTTSSN